MDKTKFSSLAKRSEPPTAFYCAAGYRPEDSVDYLMRQILAGVAKQLEQRLAHIELTNAQWGPLFKLYSGHASTVAELARVCQLDAGAMTRTLDRLEAKQLCRRVRSDTDRRVVNIALTDAGRRAAAEIPHVLSQVQNASLCGFNAEDFDTLNELLRRILANGQMTGQENTNTSSASTSVA